MRNATAAPDDAPARTELLAVGQLFLDVLYGPLPTAPVLGEETFTPTVELIPGGIANFALAARSLGARTALAARIGDGPASTLVRDHLERAGVDTSPLRVQTGWDLQVTTAIAYDGDRALVTGGPTPAEVIDTEVEVADAAAVAVHIGPQDIPWLDQVDAGRTRVFADVGWDPSGTWDRGVLRHLERCYAIMPNADEAMAYTRTSSSRDALHALASLVPLAVVTCGADGALALDAATGTEVKVPVTPLGPVDPTGAGDTFGAALITLLGRGLELRDAVEASSLAATARAAAVIGPGRTPDLATLTTIARQHDLACADALGTLVGP